jgi:hypothetical protein
VVETKLRESPAKFLAFCALTCSRFHPPPLLAVVAALPFSTALLSQSPKCESRRFVEATVHGLQFTPYVLLERTFFSWTASRHAVSLTNNNENNSKVLYVLPASEHSNIIHLLSVSSFTGS